MKGGKILIQFIFAVAFFAAVAGYANKVLSDSSLELFQLFDLISEAAQKLGINISIGSQVREYISERNQFITSLLIGAEFLVIFLITTWFTWKFRVRIKNPLKTKRVHFFIMFVWVVLLALIQMMFLNVREFNSASTITIQSLFIPACMLSGGLALSGLFVGKRIGAHYVLPRKVRASR